MFQYSPEYIVYTFSKDGAVKNTYYENIPDRIQSYINRYQKYCDSNDEKMIVYKKISLEFENEEDISSEDVKAQIHQLEQRIATLETQLHLELNKKKTYPSIEFSYVTSIGIDKNLITFYK